MEVIPTTISKEKPLQRSSDYELLREEGLKYTQEIAGKIWTDYNSHDPGLTILEVLSYAITDLGYRTSYGIKDIIAQDPDNPQTQDIKNFFTACEILPNCPVTINDYRKLMIDVEVYDTPQPEDPHVGVKNAWIEQAEKSEIDIYVNKEDSELVYNPVNAGDQPLDLKILYNILLEFGTSDEFGDLNENKVDDDLLIEEHIPEPELEGLIIRVEVEFPRWDNPSIDWDDNTSIREGINNIELAFLKLGDNFQITYGVTATNEVTLSGTKNTASGPDPIDGLNDITIQVNDLIYNITDSLIALYKRKINKVQAILSEVKSTLHAHRNLCEDFVKFSALRIEEILVCADIELELDANVEEAQAQIYHEIAKFLSPIVNFYTLEEMYHKCHDQTEYSVKSIDTGNNKFVIEGLAAASLPEKDTTLIISGSNNNDGVYTLVSARLNKENEMFYDITVKENIPSDLLTEGETLYFGEEQEQRCLSTEKIFEGPKLKHGFIDDEELAKADRKKVIHVSDLIQIIMDIPGVIAVRNIQIANVPQDNDGTISSKNVKWCLSLAYDKNYVPRLNTIDSKITFFKDQLPFRARQIEVEEMMEALQADERPQKDGFPFMDIRPPKGEYKEIEDYYSIQNDFPLLYGIGEEGLPDTNSDKKPNKAQARQLKGYLMFFDQLLANYLSQLAHVKDLFSMNAERDELGNYEIGRTYFTQSLIDIVPDVESLYVDMAGHEVALDNIAESAESFEVRRNRFLDHLMARFAEQFTDYALLSYRLDEAKASSDLIADKLAFLNAYPKLSAGRGKAFDYYNPCKLWHVDNVSGLEKRAAMLVGVDDRKASTLVFNAEFVISGTAPALNFTVENANIDAFLESVKSYESEDDARMALENLIVAGVTKENYRITEESPGAFSIELLCDDDVVAQSVKKDFTADTPGGDADQVIDDIIARLSTEFYDNPESNRHNLACSLLNYFDYNITTDMAEDPPLYEISYELNKTAFGTDPILTGSATGTGDAKRQEDILNIDTGTNTITVEGNVMENLNAGDPVVITGSGGNDGTYTIDSFSLNGDDTDIIVTEVLPTDTAPMGQLGINIMTEAELISLAESKVHDALWSVAYHGTRQTSYQFDPHLAPYTSPYKFQIADLRGNILAESVAFDFNQYMVAEIMAVTSGKVTVQSSTANDGEYDIVSADHKGPDIEIQVTPSPASTLPDGELAFTETFVIKDINKEDRIFVVEADLTGKLKQSDMLEVTDTASNDRSYRLSSFSFDGTDTRLTVMENIPSEEVEGNLSYTKAFPITAISGDTFSVKGGADDEAVQDMIDFLKSKFFDHEGLHLIEHILLRPKVNEPLFVDMEPDALDETLADFGQLTFRRHYGLKSADSTSDTLLVDGDITADLTVGVTIVLSEAPINNGAFTITAVSFDGVNTVIEMEEDFLADIAEGEGGILSFEEEEAISSMDTAGGKIKVNGNFSSTLQEGSIVEIKGSENGTNDGRYTISSHADAGADTDITVDKKESLVQDELLPINLDEECECTLEDPYTCIAHVVLPYWPERFLNKDFRKFFEKTLRLEAPAHVFLNICWVSCEHMAELELKYKAWLIENAKENKDKVKLSTTLGELIDILGKLRNVYPVGTLHDCDEDENLENSIILNNSVLGEI